MAPRKLLSPLKQWDHRTAQKVGITGWVPLEAPGVELVLLHTEDSKEVMGWWGILSGFQFIHCGMGTLLPLGVLWQR